MGESLSVGGGEVYLDRIFNTCDANIMTEIKETPRAPRID